MQSAAFLLVAVGVMALGLIGIGIWKFVTRPREQDSVAQFQSSLDALSTFGGADHDRGRRRAKR